MGHRFAAAGLQFRRAARGLRRRCLLGVQAPRGRTGQVRRRAGVSGDRDPAQLADRLRLRLLRHRHGLRADLAHLVDGRRRGDRRLRHLRRVRLARSRRGYHSGGRSRTHRPPQPGSAPDPAQRRGRRRMSTVALRETHPGSRALTEAHHGSVASRGWSGPAPKRIVTGYGFWIFILSDMVMFSAFFATYAVLLGQTAGGPSGHDLFDLRNVAIEGREFASLVARGAGPTHSAFLSAFFTLVGCHGLHVSAGILWLLTMMAQVFAKGFRADIQRRILCFALFWHALDIIWIAVFTVVYLIGSAK